MKINLNKEPSFTQNGLTGFTYPLKHSGAEVSYIDCFYEHDNYCTYQKPFIYYIIEGKGRYKIGNDIINVEAGDLIEIPANTDFTYKGKMKILLIIQDKFDCALSADTRKNDLD